MIPIIYPYYGFGGISTKELIAIYVGILIPLIIWLIVDNMLYSGTILYRVIPYNDGYYWYHYSLVRLPAIMVGVDIFIGILFTSAMLCIEAVNRLFKNK